MCSTRGGGTRAKGRAEVISLLSPTVHTRRHSAAVTGSQLSGTSPRPVDATATSAAFRCPSHKHLCLWAAAPLAWRWLCWWVGPRQNETWICLQSVTVHVVACPCSPAVCSSGGTGHHDTAAGPSGAGVQCQQSQAAPGPTHGSHTPEAAGAGVWR